MDISTQIVLYFRMESIPNVDEVAEALVNLRYSHPELRLIRFGDDPDFNSKLRQQWRTFEPNELQVG